MWTQVKQTVCVLNVRTYRATSCDLLCGICLCGEVVSIYICVLVCYCKNINMTECIIKCNRISYYMILFTVYLAGSLCTLTQLESLPCFYHLRANFEVFKH